MSRKRSLIGTPADGAIWRTTAWELVTFKAAKAPTILLQAETLRGPCGTIPQAAATEPLAVR